MERVEVNKSKRAKGKAKGLFPPLPFCPLATMNVAF